MIVPDEWRADDTPFPDERFDETLFFAKLWSAVVALVIVYLVIAGCFGGSPPLEVGRTIAPPQHEVLFTTQESHP